MADLMVLTGLILGVGGKLAGLAYAGIVRDISTKVMGWVLFTGYGLYIAGFFVGGKIPGT